MERFKIIGKFVPIGEPDYRTSFNVVTRFRSDYMSPAWEGMKENGERYHVIEKAWRFELVLDGEFLPPVGCECERSWCGDKWLPCKILFISDETVVVKLATREAAYGRCEVSFRPLRTEAERAIDEMVQLSGVSTGAAKILYDAGYRK